MQRKIAIGLLSIGLSWTHLCADVSEMIFYPQADFSEGIFHFNYQGSKNKNYGFMFDRGFDANRIVYVRPEEHLIEKLNDGSIKLSFANTDRYSYVQRAYRDDFLVSEENGVYKILLSGGDCKSSPNCVTAENILTVNIPKGYGVRKYQGLDQDLKPLKNPIWLNKGNVYTLTARDVKGACVMMEVEKLKMGQVITPIAITANPIKIATAIETPKPPRLVPPPSEVKTVVAVAPVTKIMAPAIISTSPILKREPKVEKPVIVASEPATYFRNFQLFDNRVVALNEAGKTRLDEWAKLFKQSGKKTIIINSYTDDIPPQRLKHLYATNEIIAEARGKLVSEYLSSQGIDASVITVNGMGDADPVASNATEEGRSKNRRIEFVLN
ncbi:OmpA family protein [Sulfuricurvum sp.]|uniref:OmpA family protein n=1 Tax=Sulfuricurvum sp. TaxID=2025608 RepID=UPI0026283968|nr:OmpA family protein [Sulfuricurvum sp.]MDD2781600.1 OmpA family protein [Sulfuricurvum sp.]